MKWHMSYRADPDVVPLADRHYNRQSIGAPQFAPPGRVLVLKTPSAFWISSYPFAEYVKHAWAGAIVCSAFRNEGDVLSSRLIREALAATRWRWPKLPDLGMVTFVDAAKTKPKPHPGYCFRMAGFEHVGATKGGLVALQILPIRFPAAEAPIGSQGELFASRG